MEARTHTYTIRVEVDRVEFGSAILFDMVCERVGNLRPSRQAWLRELEKAHSQYVEQSDLTELEKVEIYERARERLKSLWE
ncbi:MAG: hypothetical protein ACE5QW_09335 [Thermoplasmata archaeon]